MRINIPEQKWQCGKQTKHIGLIWINYKRRAPQMYPPPRRGPFLHISAPYYLRHHCPECHFRCLQVHTFESMSDVAQVSAWRNEGGIMWKTHPLLGQKKCKKKYLYYIHTAMYKNYIIKEYLHHNQHSMIFYNDMLHWKHISHRSRSNKVDVFHLAGNLAQPSRPAQLALQTVTGDFAGWLCDADFDATIRTPISLILADTQLPERWATI